MKPWELSRLTYYEFCKMVEGYIERKENVWYKIRWLAWHLEGLARLEKMPSFDNFVLSKNKQIENKQKQKMTDEEMLAQVKKLNKIFGGTVTTK